MMQSDSDSEIIQPPTDLITRTIVEKAASFISKKGIEFEKKILLDDPRYNFLRNSEDPSHAYYKHKLAEYSSHKQQDEEEEEDEDDVIDTPPEVTTLTLVKRMARLVTQKGKAFERMVALRNKNDPRFSFLWSSFAPYRDFYQHRLTDFYKKQAHDQAIDFNDVVVGVVDEPKMLPLPKLLQYRIPKGMTMKERDVIKVTALFTAWYGVDFLEDSKICRFEFIKESDDDDSRFSLFTEFVVAYSEVLKMPRKEELRDMLRKNADYKSTIFDGFFYRIRSDVLEEHKWLEFGERVIIDWHDSVIKEFANKENPIVATT